MYGISATVDLRVVGVDLALCLLSKRKFSLTSHKKTVREKLIALDALIQ